MNIAFFAALLTLLGGSAAADNLIPYRYKKRLHDAAVRFWLRLYENEIPDLPRLLANGILKRTLNIRRRPLLTFLIYLAICAIFLSVVYSLIPFLEPPGPVVHLPTSPELRHFRPDFFDKMPLPRIELVLTIAAFDLVTLALSIHLLKSLRKDKIGVWGCKFIVHLAVIWLLAITCLATADSVGNFLFSRAALGLRYEYIEFGESQRMAFNYFASQNTNFNGGKTLGTNFIAAQITYGDSFGVNWRNAMKTVNNFIRGDNTEMEIHVETVFVNRNNWKDQIKWVNNDLVEVSAVVVLAVGTLFFPMLGIMVLLCFLFLAKIIATFGRRYTLYFIDLATESPPDSFKPFFLLGCTADLLLIFVKAVQELISKT